jgi:hypothetical protein
VGFVVDKVALGQVSPGMLWTVSLSLNKRPVASQFGAELCPPVSHFRVASGCGAAFP